MSLLILCLLVGCGERSGLIQESIDPILDDQSDPTIYVSYNYFVIDPSLEFFSQTYMLTGTDDEWNGDFQYLFDLKKLTFTVFKSNQKKQAGSFTCLERAGDSCAKFEFEHFGFWNKKTVFKIEKVKIEAIETGEIVIVPFVRGLWPTLIYKDEFLEEKVTGAYLWTHLTLRSIKYKEGMYIPLHGALPKPTHVYQSSCSWIDELSDKKELKCYFTDSFTGEIQERRWLISPEL